MTGRLLDTKVPAGYRRRTRWAWPLYSFLSVSCDPGLRPHNAWQTPPCGVTLRGERALEPADLGFPASRSRLTRPCMKGPGQRSLPEESVAVTSLSIWPLPRYQSKYTANHKTQDPRGQDQPPPHSSASISLCNQTEGHQERPRVSPGPAQPPFCSLHRPGVSGDPGIPPRTPSRHPGRRLRPPISATLITSSCLP